MPPRVVGGGLTGREVRRSRCAPGWGGGGGGGPARTRGVGGGRRAEDERRGGGLGGETDAVREHEEPAVEAGGGVVGHAARVPTAEHGGEIARGRAPGAAGIRGRA